MNVPAELGGPAVRDERDGTRFVYGDGSTNVWRAGAWHYAPAPGGASTGLGPARAGSNTAPPAAEVATASPRARAAARGRFAGLLARRKHAGDIGRLLADLNLQVRAVPASAFLVSAAAVLEPSKRMISYSRDLAPRDQLRAVAHECGHAWLRDKNRSLSQMVADGWSHPDEIAAEAFGRAFLGEPAFRIRD